MFCKSSPIHVTCSLDSKYTRFAGVLMTSLFENNKEEYIVMHIMGFELSADDKTALKLICDGYSNDVVFYDIEEERFRGFPTTKQWNIATYFRLLLPDLIDSKVERVLYLDCDIICRGPIRELYDVDLQGNIIGAVEDHVMSPRMSLSYTNDINPDNFSFIPSSVDNATCI